MDAAPTPRRRWRSYSLRTLLVVMTLLCVALGWKMNRVRDVRNVVREVERLGGNIIFHRDVDPSRGNGVPDWLERALGEHSFDAIFRIEIDDPRADDKTLELIAQLPRVDGVVVRSDRVTDRGIAAVATAPGMISLEIRSSQITAAGLAPLADAEQLHAIVLEDNPGVDDGWVDELVKLPKIQRAILNRTSISDHGLKKLLASPSLRSIEIAGTRVTPAGFAEFRRAARTWEVAW